MKGNEREIGVLCFWFELKANGTLTTHKTVEHKFLSIGNYKGTINAPLYKNESLRLPTCLSKKIFEMQGNQANDQA